MTGIALSHGYEITDIERKDTAPVGGGSKQLRLVTGIHGHPFCGRTGDVVAALDQRLLRRLDGCVSSRCSLGSAMKAFDGLLGGRDGINFLAMGPIEGQGLIHLGFA